MDKFKRQIKEILFYNLILKQFRNKIYNYKIKITKMIQK